MTRRPDVQVAPKGLTPKGAELEVQSAAEVLTLSGDTWRTSCTGGSQASQQLAQGFERAAKNHRGTDRVARVWRAYLQEVLESADPQMPAELDERLARALPHLHGILSALADVIDEGFQIVRGG
ncbi:hypothetical protein [Mycobacterium marinum]|uniref:hypothetical protein n=1 Tax=Mycobacterium marinum TaxID=1781 RepID=UPI0021C25AE6|nr:hypothetical protein [Mycobacterium marinum]